MTTNNPNRRLLAAILARAALDADCSDPGLAAPARRWLRREGTAWAEQLDIPPERVMIWMGQLPAMPWEQLTLFDV